MNAHKWCGRRAARVAALAVLVAGLIVVGVVPAMAQGAKDAGPTQGVLAVVAGQSRILEVTDLVRVAVADPAVADVVVASKTEVIINGKSEGRTTLHVWDSSGRSSFDLRVCVDNDRLLQEIRSAIGYPGLVPRFARGTLVLDGMVETEAESKRAELIARAFVERVLNVVAVKRPVSPLPSPILDASEVQAAIGIEGVRVRVLNDAIILEGVVAEPADGDRAEEIARVFSAKVLNFIPPVVEVISGAEKSYATLSDSGEAAKP